VQLRFTFASGDSANAIQVEGGTITVESEGKKLSITPHLRDHGVVELRVFQAVQREGRETMEVVDTVLVLHLLLEPRQTKLLFDDVQKLEVMI